MSSTAQVTWTDTLTGQQRTTKVTISNRGTWENGGRDVIAAAELGGLHHKDRVRIDRITPQS